MSNDWQAEQRLASFVPEVWPSSVSDVVHGEPDGWGLARLRAGLRKGLDSVAINASRFDHSELHDVRWNTACVTKRWSMARFVDGDEIRNATLFVIREHV